MHVEKQSPVWCSHVLCAVIPAITLRLHPVAGQALLFFLVPFLLSAVVRSPCAAAQRLAGAESGRPTVGPVSDAATQPPWSNIELSACQHLPRRGRYSAMPEDISCASTREPAAAARPGCPSMRSERTDKQPQDLLPVAQGLVIYPTILPAKE